MRGVKLSCFLMLFLCFAGMISAQVADRFAIAESDSTLVKAPVIFKEQVIFYIYSSLGNFTPFERSEIVTKRLDELGKQKYLYQDSLKILQGENDYTIRYGDRILYTISPADTIPLNLPMDEIAHAYHNAIATRFIPLFTRLSAREGITLIIKTVLLVLVVLLISFFIIRLLKRLIHYLHVLIRGVKRKYQEGFHLKGIRVLSAEQFGKVAFTFVNFFRFVTMVFIGYFTIYFVLLAIPHTRSIAKQLQAYIANPLASVGNAILDYLPNLFFIVIVLLVTRYILQFLRYLFNEIEKGHIRFANFYPDWADSTYQIVKFLILFFVIVIIFPYLPGSDSPAFKGVSIFVGVLFSLGSSSAIANIIAGIILTYMRAYRVGDFVRIGDRQGILMETTLLVVRIKTVKNEEITIPNAIVLSGHITDFSSYAREGNLILHTKITIGYDVPWQKVSELLVTAALRSHGVNVYKPPFVNVSALMDYYVEYELNAYTDNPNSMPMTYAELHRNILDTFAEAGVEIMSPMYNAVRNGNSSTIPPLNNS